MSNDRIKETVKPLLLIDVDGPLSPILGLPRNLPVIPLVRPRGPGTRRSWKVEQIADWAGPRPFAWFDDEINRATRDWLKIGVTETLELEGEVGPIQAPKSNLRS